MVLLACWSANDWFSKSLYFLEAMSPTLFRGAMYGCQNMPSTFKPLKLCLNLPGCLGLNSNPGELISLLRTHHMWELRVFSGLLGQAYNPTHAEDYLDSQECFGAFQSQLWNFILQIFLLPCRPPSCLPQLLSLLQSVVMLKTIVFNKCPGIRFFPLNILWIRSNNEKLY